MRILILAKYQSKLYPWSAGQVILVVFLSTLLILIKLKHLENKRATKLVVQFYVDPRRIV